MRNGRDAHAAPATALILDSTISSVVAPQHDVGNRGMSGRATEGRPRQLVTLAENARRYNRTWNFGLRGDAEGKKTEKFVFRSTLRPKEISFSHNQDPEQTWIECHSITSRGAARINRKE
jgi:hypothetical protein